MLESPYKTFQTPFASSRCLNSDVWLRISEYLFTSGDRLALALISRWHYLVLGHTAYTHIVASQELKLTLLIATLGSNTQRCNAIFHLDVVFPPEQGYLNTSKIPVVLWRSNEPNLTRDALVVLKLALNLKSLFLKNPRGYYPNPDIIDKLICDPCLFRLQCFSSVYTTKGTLDFVRNQTELTELVVLSDVNDLLHAESSSPMTLSRLHTL